MAGLNDICKDAQLNPIECKRCNKNFQTNDVLAAFFEAILKRVAAGESVRIPNFGTFRARVYKGRTLKSPVLADGEITFPDALVLRFTQSLVAKRRLNEDFTPVEAADTEKVVAKATKATKKTTKKAASKKTTKKVTKKGGKKGK